MFQLWMREERGTVGLEDEKRQSLGRPAPYVAHQAAIAPLYGPRASLPGRWVIERHGREVDAYAIWCDQFHACLAQTLH